MFDSIKVSKELLDALRPIKAQYEQAMTYTMRRYRVEEVEVVAGLATQTKSRKRSRQLSHLKVCARPVEKLTASGAAQGRFRRSYSRHPCSCS